MFNGLRMPLRDPKAFGVLIDDIEIVGMIEAAEQNNTVMGIPVVHGRNPADSVGFAKAVKTGEGVQEDVIVARRTGQRDGPYLDGGRRSAIIPHCSIF